LLEAMASGTLIVAHNNAFNKSILNEQAFYFDTSSNVSELLKTVKKKDYEHYINENILKIKNKYQWELINTQYLELMTKAYENIE
jgi:glycosyltransferase involved in cell wall biosynthesis